MTYSKLLSIVAGLALIYFGVKHLVNHDDKYGIHDGAVAIIVVTGGGIAFPDRMIKLIRAWKSNKI